MSSVIYGQLLTRDNQDYEEYANRKDGQQRSIIVRMLASAVCVFAHSFFSARFVAAICRLQVSFVKPIVPWLYISVA